VPTLYKRIKAGTLPARQEPAGRRRWMMRPSDVTALQAAHGRRPAVGEWPHDLVALLAEQNRQLEAPQAELRSKVRDLQSVLAATWRAPPWGSPPTCSTMPDTPND
jgi:hypothetical protein